MMGLGNDFDEGCRLVANGRFEEAYAVFYTLLQQQPGQPDLLNALATVLDAQGRHNEAATYLRKACQICPGDAVYHYNLGNVLRHDGVWDEAEQQYLAAIDCSPEFAEAYHGVGSLYLEKERLIEAEACLRRAVSLKPGHVLALQDLGRLASRQGNTAEAEQYYKRCLGEDPTFVPAMNELGMALLRGNRVGDAQDYFERARQLDPGYLQARCNLAVLATWQGRLAEAIHEFQALTELAPDDGDIHFNLSLALLSAGRYKEGWREHEWRFHKANPVAVRHGQIPRWQGEPLAGRAILVHAEQGYGDSLQFIRYVPLLEKRGAAVLVEGQDANITPLLATVSGVTATVSRGEVLPFAPDFQVPMMSLAAELGEAGWPPPVPPYLHPPADQVAFWRSRLALLPGLKVGIAWAGRPEHQNDANRSLSPELYAPLGQMQGVSWVGLQFGPDRPRPVPLPLVEMAEQVTNFCDSAALVSALDLVITIDSAVAHLTGALGVPVWLLLPWNPDWRWMHNRTDSPWYPSMRIYRQPAPGRWNEVISKVATDLEGVRDEQVGKRRRS